VPALSFSPSSLQIVIRVPGLGFDPPSIRNRGLGSMPPVQTMRASVSGGYPPDATLSKVGSATWLTIPAGCKNGDPFDVTVDVTALKVGSYAETILAQKAGYESADLPVSLLVQPEGPPAKGPR